MWLESRFCRCVFVIALISGCSSVNSLNRTRRQWKLPTIGSGITGDSSTCRPSFTVYNQLQPLSSSNSGISSSCPLVIATYRTSADRVLTVKCSSFSVSCSGGGTFSLKREGSSTKVEKCGESPFTFTNENNALVVTYGSSMNLFGGIFSFNFHCSIQANQTGTCDCGDRPLSKTMNRIVGGQLAALAEFPYQALIYILRDKKVFQCGGTLVSQYWVVSAAHCRMTKGNKVLLGLQDLTDGTSPNLQVISAEQVINHPLYVIRTFYYDIALVRLSSPAKLNQYVSPACLPDPFVSDSLVGTKLEVTGWGTTISGGKPSNPLRKVTVDVISNVQCAAAPNNYYRDKVFNESICTLTAGKDSCQGDSGGPLAYHTGGRSYLIGVVSHGYACAAPDLPAIYTRIPNNAILSWVKRNAGINCIAPSP